MQITPVKINFLDIKKNNFVSFCANPKDEFTKNIEQESSSTEINSLDDFKKFLYGLKDSDSKPKLNEEQIEFVVKNGPIKNQLLAKAKIAAFLAPLEQFDDIEYIILNTDSIEKADFQIQLAKNLLSIDKLKNTKIERLFGYNFKLKDAESIGLFTNFAKLLCENTPLDENKILNILSASENKELTAQKIEILKDEDFFQKANLFQEPLKSVFYFGLLKNDLTYNQV